MRDGIIYDCPNANCRTPIDTGKCSKACIEKYHKEMGIKPKTNADRIRSMSDEELATQLVQVFKEGIKVLTDIDMPEELLDKFWNSFLERLKQPAEVKENA